MFKFKRRKKLASELLTEKDRLILERENREASKGGMNPFGLNSGADLYAKISNVGFQTSSATPILGDSLQNSSVERDKPAEESL